MADADDERIINLLALLLLHQMKTAPLGEKAAQLRRAGFSNVEIADLLGTTAASVGQAIYESGSRRGSKRPSSQRKARGK